MVLKLLYSMAFYFNIHELVKAIKFVLDEGMYLKVEKVKD